MRDRINFKIFAYNFTNNAWNAMGACFSREVLTQGRFTASAEVVETAVEDFIQFVFNFPLACKYTAVNATLNGMFTFPTMSTQTSGQSCCNKFY